MCEFHVLGMALALSSAAAGSVSPDLGGSPYMEGEKAEDLLGSYNSSSFHVATCTLFCAFPFITFWYVISDISSGHCRL